MLEAPIRAATYPLLKRRRRRKLPRLPVRARPVAIGLLAFGGVMAGVYAATRPASVDPVAAVAAARAALAAGDASTARDRAAAAPGSAEAQVLLARAWLDLDQGPPAQAALARARELGAPVAALRPLAAHAKLLAGDAEGALADAGRDADGLRLRARAIAALGRRGEAALALEALLRANPADTRAWTDLGSLRFSGGEVGLVDAAASRAATLAPRDPRALLLKGELVRTRFGQRASLPWFDAALAVDRRHAPTLIERAATLGELGRHADMLADARAALAARPGDARALLLQATLAARAGKSDLARALLGRAGPDAGPAAILLAGVLDTADGGGERAIERWRALLAAQPLDLRVRSLLAAALLRSGDARGSLDALRPVIGRADADPYALSVAGRAAEALGDRAAAARLLDRAAAATPGPAPIFRTGEGVSALAAAAGRAPGDPTFALGLIRGLAGEGRGPAALSAAQALARATPGAPAAQAALGDAHAALGRWREAADAYRRAADLRFDEPALLKLVDARARARRPADAAGALSLFLSQNPRSIVARRLLGQLQLAAGDWDAAIETLEDVRSRIGPGDAGLLSELARAYAGDGDGAVARRYGAAAHALAPMNPAAVAAYAAALQADGDREGARRLRDKLARLPRG